MCMVYKVTIFLKTYTWSKDCGLRANKTDAAITRVGTIAPVITKFDQDNGAKETSGKHKKSSKRQKFNIR